MLREFQASKASVLLIAHSIQQSHNLVVQSRLQRNIIVRMYANTCIPRL